MSMTWPGYKAKHVLLEFAAAPPEGEGFDYAKDLLHDRLLSAVELLGDRAGPVEWRTYSAADAPAMLQEAGVATHPAAAGLLMFLHENPDCVLVIGSLAWNPRTLEGGR